MDKLKARRKKKTAKPAFKRQEYSKHKKLKTAWRRPKGHTSKLRRGVKARGAKPSPGYRSPVSVRGLDRKGLFEIIVRNPKDLSKVDPKTQSVVIAGTVGKKKRLEILEAAKESNIRISNK